MPPTIGPVFDFLAGDAGPEELGLAVLVEDVDAGFEFADRDVERAGSDAELPELDVEVAELDDTSKRSMSAEFLRHFRATYLFQCLL
jgi:hypothetical protein